MSLMSWGPLVFEVFPLNYDNVDHAEATDWARKEIAGAAIYREWVGEDDEEMHVRGKVFPLWLARHNQPSGKGALEVMSAMRRAGHSDLLVRGDGYVLGWFVITRMSRRHTLIAADGVGQQIDFEAVFNRVPVPEQDDYFPLLYQLIT